MIDFWSPLSFFDDDWFDFNKTALSTITTKSAPKVNVKENDKNFTIEIANPGFNKDDTNIKIKNGVISVEMSSESSNETSENEKFHCKQWSKSSFVKSWTLPENVAVDAITAKHTDGVLTITLPKTKEAVKTINVE